MAELVQYYGTGRRKRAIARVYLRPGSGDFKVNGRAFEEYFVTPAQRSAAKAPLASTDTAVSFNIVASVLGGGLGYLIGAEFFDQIARPILHVYHADGDLQSFSAWYAHYGLAVILIKGLTPIPYKLVTIASGAAHFNFFVFVAASAATRGARFFLEAGLLQRFGAQMRQFVVLRPRLVTVAALGGVTGIAVVMMFLERH